MKSFKQYIKEKILYEVEVIHFPKFIPPTDVVSPKEDPEDPPEKPPPDDVQVSIQEEISRLIYDWLKKWIKKNKGWWAWQLSGVPRLPKGECDEQCWHDYLQELMQWIMDAFQGAFEKWQEENPGGTWAQYLAEVLGFPQWLIDLIWFWF